jgi:hypothetical protein
MSPVHGRTHYKNEHPLSPKVAHNTDTVLPRTLS